MVPILLAVVAASSWGFSAVLVRLGLRDLGTASGTLPLSIGTAIDPTPTPVTGGDGRAVTSAHYHTGSATGTLAVAVSGVSAAFSVVQPSLVLNYVIRT